MKSKVFKFILPASAFALAIVFSFAFTPNGAEDAVPVTVYDNLCNQTVEDCNTTNSGPLCTAITGPFINGITPGEQLFEKDPVTLKCDVEIRRP